MIFELTNNVGDESLMMINKITPVTSTDDTCCSSLGASSSVARENVEVVGSSTVYPFATVVAERYGRASGKPTPKIESTGSGGGMKLILLRCRHKLPGCDKCIKTYEEV